MDRDVQPEASKCRRELDFVQRDSFLLLPIRSSGFLLLSRKRIMRDQRSSSCCTLPGGYSNTNDTNSYDGHLFYVVPGIQMSTMVGAFRKGKRDIVLSE